MQSKRFEIVNMEELTYRYAKSFIELDLEFDRSAGYTYYQNASDYIKDDFELDEEFYPDKKVKNSKHNDQPNLHESHNKIIREQPASILVENTDDKTYVNNVVNNSPNAGKNKSGTYGIRNENQNEVTKLNPEALEPLHDNDPDDPGKIHEQTEKKKLKHHPL